MHTVYILYYLHCTTETLGSKHLTLRSSICKIYCSDSSHRDIKNGHDFFGSTSTVSLFAKHCVVVIIKSIVPRVSKGRDPSDVCRLHCLMLVGVFQLTVNILHWMLSSWRWRHLPVLRITMYVRAVDKILITRLRLLPLPPTQPQPTVF